MRSKLSVDQNMIINSLDKCKSQSDVDTLVLKFCETRGLQNVIPLFDKYPERIQEKAAAARILRTTIVENEQQEKLNILSDKDRQNLGVILNSSTNEEVLTAFQNLMANLEDYNGFLNLQKELNPFQQKLINFIMYVRISDPVYEPQI